MHSRRSLTTFFLLAVILLSVLLAGCGGSDQSGNGSQQGGPDGAKRQEAGNQGGRAAKKGEQEVKIALGTIGSVKPEKRTIVLRPSREIQGGKRMVFKTKKKNPEITVDGKEAELEDVKKGQDAQITYFVRNERNVARAVALVGGQGGEDSGGG
jgi:hypothetical protein